MNPQSSSEECSLQLKYSLYFSTFEPIHIFDFGDMAIWGCVQFHDESIESVFWHAFGHNLLFMGTFNT